MSPVINPDTSTAVGFITMEPGTYPGKVISTEAGTSGAGNAKVVVSLEIEYEGKVQKRQAHLAITGAGSGGFEQLMRACGFEKEADIYADKSIPSSDKPPFDTDQLHGQEVNVIIGPNLYQGEMRDQVKGFLKK